MPAENPRRYFKELRFQQYRALCAIARHRSFAGAAAQLGLSVPAVWQQTRALERDLDTPLVNRHGRGVRLTEDGLLLLDLVSPLVAGLDSIPEVFGDRKEKAVRQLVVATTASLLAHDLKRPIATFRRRHPQVHLTLIDRPPTEVAGLVESGQAELGITSHAEEEPHNGLLDYELFSTWPYLLICPRNHELTRQRSLRFADFARFPLVLSRGSRLRSRFDRRLQQHGLLDKLTIVLETTNGYLVPQYVALGLGIAVTTRNCIAPVRHRLHVRSVVHLFGDISLVCVRKRGAHELAHAVWFRQIVRQALARAQEG
jgi:DNA-binding transcriptional LysR family regulator